MEPTEVIPLPESYTRRNCDSCRYIMNVSAPCGPCGAEASEDDWYPRWRERVPLGDVPEEPAVG